MANEVEFKLKITSDGKEVFHDVSVAADELDNAVRRVTQSAKKASDEIQDMAMQNLNWDTLINGIQQFNNSLQGLSVGYNSFDKSMRAANTMAGKSGKEFDALTDSVKELSKTIPMAREELAGGLYQVISNGVPEDNWISFLEQSSKAAVGGIANLGQTVTVTSTIIKNYGLEWETAGSIQDKIQRTAKNGVTSFEQLAAALPRVTGSAAQLGISIDELMAVFATTTGVTGNTAEVSTQLAAVLTALIKPSSEAAQAAERMGISFNAASIKEAGGLENFLRSLDIAINQYSAKTGELKETIYGNLFGSAEALRVLTSLTGEQKEKFSQNIQEMADSTGTIDTAFGEMASTGDAANQMLKNSISAITDHVGAVTSAVAPYASLASDISITAANAYRFYKTIGPIITSMRASTIAVGANTTALGLNRVMTTSTSAVMRVHRTLLITLTAATGSLTAATVALTAAYTMGLSLAIMGIASLFTSTGNKAEEASKKQDILQASTEAFTSTAARLKGEIDMEISALSSLIKSHGDETSTVEELNRKYGEALGYHKSAAEWYDILISKSAAYCQAIGYEAQARVLASQKAEKELQLEAVRKQKQALIDSGGDTTTKRIMTSGLDAAGNKTVKFEKRQVNTDAYQDLRMQEARLVIESHNLGEAFTSCMEKIQAGKNELKSTSQTTAASSKAIGINTMSYTDLGTAIEENEKKLKKLAPTETAEISRLSNYNKLLKKRKETLGRLYGLGSNGSKAGSNDTAAIGSLAALEARLNELKAKQKNAPVEIQLTFTQDIVQLEQVIADIKDRLEHAKFVAKYTLKPTSEDSPSDRPIKNAMQSSTGKGGALEGFKIPEMDIEKPLSSMEAWNAALDAAREKNAEAIGSMGAMSSAVGSLGNVIGGQAGAWLDWAGNLLGAIAQALPQLAALATANTAAAATGAASSVAGIPFVGPIMAVSAVASVLAALTSLPKFADGGIAYGPTLGLFGEYAGAGNNPEVVAPLNKLRQLIQPTGDSGMGGKVEFVIDGRNLRGVLNKIDNFNRRTV